MSKNVAVFVDVANIFYAAKAAGVDIDYVTLLKSATAGRDFVRAYAYTGLDPENENQKQFHGFLARSGYKVVSKDIRKYGDGRVKANLDIELVVDLMRMAEKLDVAVIVSGDGDFAPAIYAVQQQGVRVEVISFRGNTSSDLIDAADIFIDISSVAKVEKGLRSGRRVAAEGDLSMTEVPDKESGVVPRRRRRDADEKPERPTRRRGSQAALPKDAEVPLQEVERPAAALVALPGERLSRGPVQVVTPTDIDIDVDMDAAADAAEATAEPQAEEGRRRRRRRGGRGRGRGGRGAEAGPTGEIEDGAGATPDELEADLPDFADEVLPLPQHSGFGSVWDSQIGVAPERRPAAPASPRGEDAIDELDVEGEPEVPEYLLAEKRQQDRRRGGRGGRGGGYRSAIDRERYGSGPRPAFQRGPVRPGRSPGRPVSGGRASAQAMEPIEQTPGGDPWSEVPPDVQEMLRAELARRQAASGQPSGRQPATGKRTTAPAEAKAAPTDVVSEAPVASAPSEDAKPKRAPRKRTTTPAEAKAASTDVVSEAPVASAPSEDAKPKRAPRKRTTTPAEANEA